MRAALASHPKVACSGCTLLPSQHHSLFLHGIVHFTQQAWRCYSVGGPWHVISGLLAAAVQITFLWYLDCITCYWGGYAGAQVPKSIAHTNQG